LFLLVHAPEKDEKWGEDCNDEAVPDKRPVGGGLNKGGGRRNRAGVLKTLVCFGPRGLCAEVDFGLDAEVGVFFSMLVGFGRDFAGDFLGLGEDWGRLLCGDGLGFAAAAGSLDGAAALVTETAGFPGCGVRTSGRGELIG